MAHRDADAVEAQILEIQELELSTAIFSRSGNRTGAGSAPVVFAAIAIRKRSVRNAQKSAVVMAVMVVVPVMPMTPVTVMPMMMVMPMPSPMHLGGL